MAAQVDPPMHVYDPSHVDAPMHDGEPGHVGLPGHDRSPGHVREVAMVGPGEHGQPPAVPGTSRNALGTHSPVQVHCIQTLPTCVLNDVAHVPFTQVHIEPARTSPTQTPNRACSPAGPLMQVN